MAKMESSSDQTEKIPDLIRILSIDGGGILGLIPLILMQRLETSRADFLDKVDLFAGTSTGGIIALGLARGVHLGKIRELYEKKGPRMFTRSLLHRFGLLGPKYVNKNLKQELKEVLGDTEMLKDLSRHVMVPTFDLDDENPDEAKRSWKPKFFANYPDDDDALIYKVALSTSAAPTYFPTYRGYIDGGVFANNPSMCAVAKALREYPQADLSRIRVLSFATYDTNQYINPARDFGMSGVRTIVDILLNGSEQVVDYQCRELLGKKYCRVRPKQQPGVQLKLDDVKKISIMTNIAEMTDLQAVGEWLDENW